MTDTQQELYTVPRVERTTHSHPVLHGLGDAERAGLEVTDETVEVLVGEEAEAAIAAAKADHSH